MGFRERVTIMVCAAIFVIMLISFAGTPRAYILPAIAGIALLFFLASRFGPTAGRWVWRHLPEKLTYRQTPKTAVRRGVNL